MASRRTRYCERSPGIEGESSDGSPERTALNVSLSTDTIISENGTSQDTEDDSSRTKGQLALKLYKYGDKISCCDSCGGFL